MNRSTESSAGQSTGIGTIAAIAQARHLVLSHRMLRTPGSENETEAEIRRRYSGPIAFADNLDCFPAK
jgi:ribonuclease BN (tRNA processing enzyme)